MSSATLTTATRSAAHAPARAWWRAHPFADAIGLSASLAAAAMAWRPAYDSFRYLLMIVVAALVGFGCARIGIIVAGRASAPGRATAQALAATLAAVAAYLALSPVTVLGVPTDFRRMAPVPVTGWKDMLSSLPPVDVGTTLGGLPVSLGLAAGVIGGLLAHRPRAWMPVTVPVTVLGLMAFLGTTNRAWAMSAAALTAAATACWGAVRRRRVRRVAGTGGARISQAAIAVALLGVSALGTGIAIPHLPGVESRPRLLARTLVEPPFDVSELVSPLVGFRRYGAGLNQLWGQELLTVTGAARDARLRFAVLDSYDGTTWSAGTMTATGGVFHRVGGAFPEPETPGGEPQQISVTIGDAYAAIPELASWVPGLGTPTRAHFAGPHGGDAATSLRFNPATGQLLVPSRLASGTVIEQTTYVVREVPKTGIEPDPLAAIDQAGGAFVAPWVAEWAGDAEQPWARLAAIGRHLETTGAYSDGTRQGEEDYWPGHGQGRLLRLLAGPQPVGSDEQYAAAFALLAQQTGIAARVVMGAIVPGDGHVRGQDVHAWVEVREASGEWLAVPNSLFMPQRSKRPKQTDYEDAPPAEQAVVPAPVGRRPPGSVDSLIEGVPPLQRPRPSGRPTESNPGLPGLPAESLPGWVTPVARYAGPPLAMVGGTGLLLAGLRAGRRSRRRSRGDASRRLAAGWRDLIDHARDLGHHVEPGHTRLEQAAVIGHADLAGRANRAVFDSHDPSPDAVSSYWADIAKARKSMSRGASWKARLSRPWHLRGLLARE